MHMLLLSSKSLISVRLEGNSLRIDRETMTVLAVIPKATASVLSPQHLRATSGRQRRGSSAGRRRPRPGSGAGGFDETVAALDDVYVGCTLERSGSNGNCGLFVVNLLAIVVRWCEGMKARMWKRAMFADMTRDFRTVGMIQTEPLQEHQTDHQLGLQQLRRSPLQGKGPLHNISSVSRRHLLPRCSSTAVCPLPSRKIRSLRSPGGKAAAKKKAAEEKEKARVLAESRRVERERKALVQARGRWQRQSPFTMDTWVPTTVCWYTSKLPPSSEPTNGSELSPQQPNGDIQGEQPTPTFKTSGPPQTAAEREMADEAQRVMVPVKFVFVECFAQWCASRVFV